MASYTLRKVDDTLWQRFKAAAAIRGLSMRAAFLLAIERFVRETKG